MIKAVYKIPQMNAEFLIYEDVNFVSIIEPAHILGLKTYLDYKNRVEKWTMPLPCRTYALQLHNFLAVMLEYNTKELALGAHELECLTISLDKSLRPIHPLDSPKTLGFFPAEDIIEVSI